MREQAGDQCNRRGRYVSVRAVPRRYDRGEERRSIGRVPGGDDPCGRREWIIQYGDRHRGHSVDRTHGRAAQHEGLWARQWTGREGRIGEPSNNHSGRVGVG